MGRSRGRRSGRAERGRRSRRVERGEVPYPYRYQRVVCHECGEHFVLGESLRSEGVVLDDGCLMFMAACPKEGCNSVIAGIFGTDGPAVESHREELKALGAEMAAAGGTVKYEWDERLNGEGRFH